MIEYELFPLPEGYELKPEHYIGFGLQQMAFSAKDVDEFYTMVTSLPEDSTLRAKLIDIATLYRAIVGEDAKCWLENRENDVNA